MSFLDIFKKNGDGDHEVEPQTEMAKTDETTISVAKNDDLALAERRAAHKISHPLNNDMAGFIDRLIPLAAAGADAAGQYDMAIVTFPKGSGWKDLCVRKCDGRNLLSIQQNGKFTSMAGIQKAGLQPAAIANLAMQGAAVAVGAAYMAQISEQLEGIESGIEAITRELQRERNAKLQSSFDMLKRYSNRFEEYTSSPEKKQAALNGIEQSLKDATTLWHFQIDSMNDLCLEIQGRRKANQEDVLKYFDKLCEMENRSAAAFQLIALVGQLEMRYDDDFSEKRIDSEKEDLRCLTDAFNDARDKAHMILEEKTRNVGGSPIALAEPTQASREGAGVVRGLLDNAGSNLARVNPVRMMEAGKASLESRRHRLVEQITVDNPVRKVSEQQHNALDEVNFMYNHIDSMIFKGSEIIFLETRSEEGGHPGSNPENQNDVSRRND